MSSRVISFSLRTDFSCGGSSAPVSCKKKGLSSSLTKREKFVLKHEKRKLCLGKRNFGVVSCAIGNRQCVIPIYRLEKEKEREKNFGLCANSVCLCKLRLWEIFRAVSVLWSTPLSRIPFVVKILLSYSSSLLSWCAFPVHKRKKDNSFISAFVNERFDITYIGGKTNYGLYPL